MPVKLEKEIEEYFEEAEEDDFQSASDEGHGRVEHRSYFLSI